MEKGEEGGKQIFRCVSGTFLTPLKHKFAHVSLFFVATKFAIAPETSFNFNLFFCCAKKSTRGTDRLPYFGRESAV